jgi:hypothetical protein
MLNFDHGINDKTIHNFLAYYNYKKHKKSRMLRELQFLFHMKFDYICARKVCHDLLKKCKVLHKQLKQFFIFMKFAIFTRQYDSI